MVSFGRKLGFFLIVPLTTFVVVVLATAVLTTNYQSQHNGRIYTGVNIWGVDLSQMTLEEAEQALLAALPYAREETIIFTDPQSNQTWVRTSRDLGMSFDVAATIDNAMLVGRQGAQTTRLLEMFEVWYYGRSLARIVQKLYLSPSTRVNKSFSDSLESCAKITNHSIWSTYLHGLVHSVTDILNPFDLASTRPHIGCRQGFRNPHFAATTGHFATANG